jgi:hypothetical protein
LFLTELQASDCSVRPLSFPVGHSLGHEVKEGDENPDAGQDVHDGELGFVGRWFDAFDVTLHH